MYLLIYLKTTLLNSNIREETIIFCGKLNIIDLTHYCVSENLDSSNLTSLP